MRPTKTSKIGYWELPGKRNRFWPRLSPPQLFVLSFFLVIVLGTVGLKNLSVLYREGIEPLTWLDALFTITSAVCVTGLVVVNTADYFSWAGQAYILLFIQLGGLGIIAFTSLIIAALGRRLSLHHEAISWAAVEATGSFDRRRLIFDVVRFTFIIEGTGALLLYLIWIPRLGFVDAFWPAIFHSVSAFCNAGFSNFQNNLMDMQDSPLALTVIAFLIIFGGLGFFTLEEMYLRQNTRKEKQPYRISLHSRLVLATTIALVLVGWLAIALLEWDVTLKQLDFGDKLANSFFMSVTPRTAGFNNIDYTEATESTCFVTILLMFIGGSPGSTAGGLKTTTFALLGIVAWSRLRGQLAVSIWNRSIRDETINRTIGLAVVVFAVQITGVLFLTLGESNQFSKGQFLHRVFEVVSAFNTVGLSMNLSDKLSDLGKWTDIWLMFLGRVGTLTFASALAVRYARAGHFRYAYEDVVVG